MAIGGDPLVAAFPAKKKEPPAAKAQRRQQAEAARLRALPAAQLAARERRAAAAAAKVAEAVRLQRAAAEAQGAACRHLTEKAGGEAYADAAKAFGMPAASHGAAVKGARKGLAAAQAVLERLEAELQRHQAGLAQLRAEQQKRGGGQVYEAPAARAKGAAGTDADADTAAEPKADPPAEGRGKKRKAEDEADAEADAGESGKEPRRAAGAGAKPRAPLIPEGVEVAPEAIAVLEQLEQQGLKMLQVLSSAAAQSSGDGQAVNEADLVKTVVQKLIRMESAMEGQQQGDPHDIKFS